MDFKSDLDALVLGVLQLGPAHGYEIAKRIRVRSAQVLEAGENRLYPGLRRLEEEGLISSSWEEQDNRPPRKIYRLTEAGSTVLAGKQHNWATFAAAVNNILGAPVAREGHHG